MAAPHSSVVIGNSNEIVNCLAVISVDDVGPHVEVLSWEVDVRVQLVSPVPVVAETLQADDQN